ncbi:MAG TPA: hypothetical protein VKW09_11735 [bacterium]|nr:hypothetical protein [bacterium]
MMSRFIRTAVVLIVPLAIACGAGAASAGSLQGCASGAAPGQLVYTVSVSATGKPFVSTYVASAPTAGGNAGCAAPLRSTGASFVVNGPGVAPYPLSPGGAAVPATVHMVQAGPYMLTIPANPSLQVYQIAPGYYVVRSLDPSGNATVILPLPGVPQAPNTGPIPSVIH